jgi:hypothetical protein
MSLITNECGFNLQDVLHLLAGTLVTGDDGITKIRVKLYIEDCTEIEPFQSCALSHLPPDEILKNAFTVDECGNLILNVSIPEIPT